MTLTTQAMPMLVLRGMVIFPDTSLNFDVGREKSEKALLSAQQNDGLIFLAAQRDISQDDPDTDGIYTTGTICRVKQAIKLPGGNTRVLVDGLCRAQIREVITKSPYYNVVVEETADNDFPDSNTMHAYDRQLKLCFEQYFNLNPRMNAESFIGIMMSKNAANLAYRIAANIFTDVDTKQEILECASVSERIERLIVKMNDEVQILKAEKDIADRTKKQIDKNQREYYLREQLKAIQTELGDKDGIGADAEEFRTKINKLKASKDIKEKLLKEVARFEKMQSFSSESAVLRTYLETVLALPWNKKTKEIIDLEKASAILERDHYGLEKVKQRILEYLAVRKLTSGAHSPILCLVGPPGVGKTSIAHSIAEALGRKYVRISLGGVHDESDIRGHRKTYIGAMPGRIMTAVSQAKCKNPLMLLDEIDKMGADYKGDPSAALLEVLDSEQNGAFRDHYTEVDFDLSEVLFITTANTLDTISRPLLDRMEIVDISGYTEDDKVNIACDYLIARQKKINGLEGMKITIGEDTIRDIINFYTREAGVRGLEKQIGTLFQKIAKCAVEESKKSFKITPKNLEKYLGRHKFKYEMKNASDEIGVVRGLAWTAAGGDTLSVEVNVMKGTGKLQLTGKLGDVMKESASAAISYARANAEKFGIDPDFYDKTDIHIHVPEGAVPKDGPSAGITMATAVISALSNTPVRADVAMTGEVTLRGRVLAIGGLREKSAAAHRAGIKTVLMPSDNIPDLDDIPDTIKRDIKFIPVSTMSEVLNHALARDIKPYVSAHEDEGISAQPLC